MGQNVLSLQLTMKEAKAVKDILLENGWMERENSNEHVILRMQSFAGSICTLYSSRKIVFQGHEDFSGIASLVQKSKPVSFKPHLGVDEVGKGDYFGPLVVASCFVTDDFFQTVSSLGVVDSKKLSDSRIRNIYKSIKDYPYYYVSIVKPAEYNELIKEYENVAILLAKQHSKVIEMALEDLQSKGVKCNDVVIDQFSSKESRVVDELGELGRSVNFKQFHKGESDIAVACASVYARAVFLEEMDRMNDEYYFLFPKGAFEVVDSAKRFVKLHGRGELEKVAKISFKTTSKVLSF